MGRRRRRGHHGGANRPEIPLTSGSPRFIEPVLLLLLKKKSSSYGYELIENAAPLSISGEPPDPGSIYKILRRMELEGLVFSEWEFSNAGPARRHYQITGAGNAMLDNWLQLLRKRRDALNYFIALYDQLA